MTTDRRDFLKGMGASVLAASGGFDAFAASVSARAPLLKVGILSDIHCHPDKKKGWLAPYFRLMDEAKVDAVMIPGDLGINGTIREVELMAEEWQSVFRNDCRSDGTPIEKLFVSGNHDDLLRSSEYKSAEDVRQRSYLVNREKTWERLFHEPWAPIRLKTVKGYDFILKNWCAPRSSVHGVNFPGDKSPTAAFIAANARRLKKSGRPFFYVQHEPLDDTVNAAWLLYGQMWENGQCAKGGRAVFDPFPNAVVITGHTHNSLTDDMSIWQGGFTAVNASCTSGNAFTQPGRENGYAEDDFLRNPPLEMPPLRNRDVRQGLIMEVYADRIHFRKLDLMFGESLGEDWDVPLFAGGATVPPKGVPKYDFKTRSEKAPVPQFAPDAKITVSLTKEGHRRHPKYAALADPTPVEQLLVSFPPALAGDRAFDYRVVVFECCAAIDRVLAEKRVFSPNAMQGVAREKADVVCAFGREYIPLKKKLRIVVTPWNCWGRHGASISLTTMCG